MNDVIQDTSAARALAELVLGMQMGTAKGHKARSLARQVLGIEDCGKCADVVCITTNGTTRLIPHDEPVFLIRGQDRVGANAVRAWAMLAEASGAGQQIVRGAREHADKMDAWPKKKTADLPRDIEAEIAAADKEGRCYCCGWPLKDTVAEGCVRGNCSFRPNGEPSYEGWRTRMHEAAAYHDAKRADCGGAKPGTTA